MITLLAVAAPARASYGFSSDLVQLAWFYKPPADGNLSVQAHYFDNFILTRRDEAARDQLQALGVSVPIVQYYLSNAVHNPGPNDCKAQPWGNTVADQPGDYCWIRDNHPDWFLYDAQGKPVTSSGGGQTVTFMNPANPGWQQFFVERLLARQQTYGWQGLFLDNVDGGLQRFQQMNVTLRDYPDDESYVAAVESFLLALHEGYQHATDRPILANLTELSEQATWFRYLEYLDGAMEEGWGVDWHSGYYPVSIWEENIDRAIQTQALGKRAILVSQADDRDDLQRQQFAFASYLLASNGNAAFRYASSTSYDEPWLYDNYDQAPALGQPLGAAYRQQGNDWRRDFEHGYVTANPETHASAIVVQQPTPTPLPSPTPRPTPRPTLAPPPGGWPYEIYLPAMGTLE